MSPRIRMFDGVELLSPSLQGHQWVGKADGSFKPESMNSIATLKEKGRLYFRQALLEIVLGEKQASYYFPDGQSENDKQSLVALHEKDLREGLHWGDIYLATKRLHTWVRKPTISHSPIKAKLPKPYTYVASQSEIFEQEFLSQFTEWESFSKKLESALPLPVSTTELKSLINIHVALYIVVYKPDFPEEWPYLTESCHSKITSEKNILEVDEQAETFSLNGQTIKFKTLYQFDLFIRLCNAGSKGVSNEEFEQNKTAIKTSSRFTRYISEINTQVASSFSPKLPKADYLFKPIKGQSGYRLSEKYSLKP